MQDWGSLIFGISGLSPTFLRRWTGGTGVRDRVCWFLRRGFRAEGLGFTGMLACYQEPRTGEGIDRNGWNNEMEGGERGREEERERKGGRERERERERRREREKEREGDDGR
jgi:hypothetical protein